MGIYVIKGPWRHHLVVFLAHLGSLFADLICILSLGFLGANWVLGVHMWGLEWRQRVEDKGDAR